MRPRGNIEELSSGSLRVRVYAGVDVLTGRELNLRQVVPAGPRAQQRAEKVRDELVRQVEEGRRPRTKAPVAQLVGAEAVAAALPAVGTAGHAVQTRRGPVQVQIVVDAGRVTDVTVPQYPGGNHRAGRSTLARCPSSCGPRCTRRAPTPTW